MEEEKTDYIKIGKRYEIRDHFTYECGLIPGCPGIDGWYCMCFKDEEIFLNEPKEICYITECMFVNSFDENLQRWITFDLYPKLRDCYGESIWSHDSIIDTCKLAARSLPEFHFSLEEFAYRVFKEATWTLNSGADLRYGMVDDFRRVAMLMEKERQQQLTSQS